jgi:hypothetical protein
VLHWDGTAWSSIPFAASGQVRALWGSGPADVYAAAGSDGLFRFESPPQPWDVWGTSSIDVWVVGNGSSSRGDIWHWDGTAWSTTHTVPGTGFEIVRGTGANDVWALGSGISGGLAAHFDGTTWTDGTLDPLTVYFDAWARGPGDMLAVTSFGPSTGEVRRLFP